MTVRELLARIDSRELAEWIQFHCMSPIGDERGDLQAGIVAATIANCNTGKSGKAFQPIDFMPITDGETRTSEQSSDDMKSILDAMVKG